MTIEKFLLLVFIQTILSAIIAVLCFVKFKSRNLVIRLIGFVFLSGSLANTASVLLVRYQTFRTLTNIPPIIYLGIATALYSWVYYILMNKKHPKLFLFPSIAWIAFALYNIFFLQKNAPNSYSLIFHSSIVITYVLVYFYFLIRNLPSLYVHRLPSFWFSAALLFYHSGAFFLFSFMDYLVNVLRNNLLTYWSFHNMLSIVEHFIFLIGVYYDVRLLKSKEVATQPKEGYTS